MVAAQTPGRTVLVVCYMNRVVENLRSYFGYALLSACEIWHRALKLSPVAGNRSRFDKLVEYGILFVVGPLRCRGLTADVGLLVTMKRQWKGATNQGLDTLSLIHI